MRTWILGVCLALAAISGRAERYRFDFGSGALRPGWTRVTETDSRWSGGAVFAEGCEVPDYAALAATDKVLPLYPNELDCDFVGGSAAATFTAAVADGEYRCWTLFGFASEQTNPMRPPHFDTEVTLNGAAAEPVRLRAPAMIESRSYRCRAENGRLTVRFRTDGVQWLVAALMLYTEEDAGAAATELAAVEREINFLPAALASRWTLRQRLETEPLADLAAADQERGYVLFRRHYLEELYLDSRPARAEIDASVRAFAAAGEFEPLTFCIYPLRDLHITQVTAELPGTRLQVAREVCAAYKEGGYNSAVTGRYRIAPSYLAPLDARGVVLRAGEPVRFWLTARVLDDTAPGLLQGRATLTFADAAAAVVPLALEVLPFRLEKDPDLTYGAYYDTRLWFFLNGNWAEHPRRERLAELVEAYTRAFLADYRDHGMNALSAPVTWELRDGEPVAAGVDISSRMFALYREYGLDRPALYWRMRVAEIIRATQGEAVRQQWRDLPADLEDPQFYMFLQKVVRAIETERLRNGWPEIVYTAVDEPFGTREQALFAEAANRAIRETGARTYCTMKTWLTARLSPVVDLRTYGLGFLGNGYPTNDTAHPEATGRFENTRPGQEYWVYPNVLTSHSCATAAAGRFIYGLYGFKTGIQGYNPWHHGHWRGNPFNEMDHFYSGGRFVLPGPEGPLPTLAYEGAREGIDDMRYIYTLQRAIGRTRNADAAKAAAALLVEIRAQVPSYRDWVMRFAASGRVGSRMIDDLELRKLWTLGQEPAWPTGTMQTLRRRLADAIVALREQPADGAGLDALKAEMQAAHRAKQLTAVLRAAAAVLEHPAASGADRGLARYRIVGATIASGAEWDSVVVAGAAMINEADAVPAHVMYGCTSIGQAALGRKQYGAATRWLQRARTLLVTNQLWGSAPVVCRDLSASQWLQGDRSGAAETVLEALQGMDRSGKPLAIYFQRPFLSRLAGLGADRDRQLRGLGQALNLAGRTGRTAEIAPVFELVRARHETMAQPVAAATSRFFLECLGGLVASAGNAEPDGDVQPAELAASIAAYAAKLRAAE